MDLAILAGLLAAASTFDIQRGSVPILLLAAIPLLGAIDVAATAAPHDWAWRLASATVLTALAILAGRLGLWLRGACGRGIGAADLLVIGSAALWLSPPDRAPVLPGLFLASGGLLGIYWTFLWRRFGRRDWRRPEDPDGAVPMLPPLSVSLFLFAVLRF